MGSRAQPGGRKQGRGPVVLSLPPAPWGRLVGAATSSETLRHPRTGLGHRRQGGVGRVCAHCLSFSAWIRSPAAPGSLIPTFPHTSRTPLTQHLARGSHVLGQMAFGIGRLGGHVISGKSLERRDPSLLLGRMERVADLRRRVVQPVFPELKRTRILDGAPPGQGLGLQPRSTPTPCPPRFLPRATPPGRPQPRPPARAGTLGLAPGSPREGQGPPSLPHKGSDHPAGLCPQN